jgi:peptidoglycan/LPS O-acetylase OafA/YrhL
LDVIRFFAFLLVFLLHCLPQTPGVALVSFVHSAQAANLVASIVNMFGFGLCLFFFLSAYLITELLLRERARTGTIHIASFYQRRMLRIWPLYLLATAIGAAIAFAGHSTGDLMRCLSYIFMLGNLYAVRHGWTSNPISPLWSISVEEQFYIIWPLLIKLTGEIGAWVGAAFFAITAFAVTLHLANAGSSSNIEVWANSFVQFMMFAAGTMFALACRGRTPNLPNWLRCVLPVAAFGLWFIATFVLKIRSEGKAPGGLGVPAGFVLVAVGCALLCASLLGIQARMPSVLVYLGKISYGLYVFHEFAMYIVSHGINGTSIAGRLIRIFLSLALTVLLAAISYRYFETPFLRMKDRLSSIRTRPA